MTPEQILIQRLEELLTLPYVPNVYFKSEQEYRDELTKNIKEVKQKLNADKIKTPGEKDTCTSIATGGNKVR